jgi:response regulator RpfG family c-di-GMP phosphodiesterase
VKDQVRQLAETRGETWNRLAAFSGDRYGETSRHAFCVGALAAMVARALGQSEEDVELLRLATPLQDIWKDRCSGSHFCEN